MKTYFITGTGTEVGKTFFTRGFASALHYKSFSVAAIKPFETGCQSEPVDALQIARACGHKQLATLPSFYRAGLPLAPFAATLGGEDQPDYKAIIHEIERIQNEFEFVIIEGAGGPLVPLDGNLTIADFFSEIDCEVVLVAQNGLGVLSHTLTAKESIESRGLKLHSVILNERTASLELEDVSTHTNEKILRAYLNPIPIFSFPLTEDNDEVLAKAVKECGFLDHIQSRNRD